MDPNIIAYKAVQQFHKLPKKGKPNGTKEWTTMAAIIQEQISLEGEDAKSDLKVISIGTGTKCLGKNELSGLGDVVSDSHAEVIARRSFLLYLYEQLELCKSGHVDKSILKFVNSEANKNCNIVRNLKLREDISFHMFISHSPCGDAAIIGRIENESDNSAADCDSDSSTPPIKKPRTEDKNNATDSQHEHRTGAKLQVGPLQYEEMQVSGRCRVKPGKGDPTLCMSCSDKLAKWQAVGLQGSLLSIFIVEPLRLKSVTIGGNVPFSKESLERALFTRFSHSIQDTIKDLSILSGYQCPEIYQSVENFMKFSENLSPAPASISWYSSHSVLDPTETVQVLVGGRKQGATKKFFGKPSSMVEICRLKTFTRFKNVYSSLEGINSETCKKYSDMKAMSEKYVEWWGKLKNCVFLGWTEKPNELQLFI